MLGSIAAMTSAVRARGISFLGALCTVRAHGEYNYRFVIVNVLEQISDLIIIGSDRQSECKLAKLIGLVWFLRYMGKFFSENLLLAPLWDSVTRNQDKIIKEALYQFIAETSETLI